MKQIWEKLGFHKADEMERFILFKAQRNSYIFLVIALSIWSLYESCKVYREHSRLNLFPCLLLAAAAMIQTFSQLILTRSAVKDDVDSYETGPLMKFVVLVCAVVGIIASAIAAIVLMGVRV